MRKSKVVIVMCPSMRGVSRIEREWDIAEQVRIAKANYDARPEWVKSISHFAGTNNVEASGDA